VRADLPRGIQAANIVHAAGESSPGGLPSGTHAVVLTVPDELTLQRVAAKLAAANVAFVRIEEPDAPWDGALMALGLVPARKEDVRRLLSSLPLLR
jgi:hypothetical protein